MKKIFMIMILISSSFLLAGCDDLVNGMGTNQRLSAEDTAQVLDDLIKMGFNSDNGVFVVTFDAGSENQEVHIQNGSGNVCITVNGDSYFPYDLTSWNASFGLTLDNCQGESDSVYSGDISVHLSGPLGSVTGFDFTGTLTVSGPINGTVALDLHYEMNISCLINWDCWTGSVNGYSIARLSDAYFN